MASTKACKRFDLAIGACNQLQLPLVSSGRGRSSVLGGACRPTIRFLGRLTDAQAAYARCHALIFPGQEGFGLTRVECMARAPPKILQAEAFRFDASVFAPRISDSVSRTLEKHRSLCRRRPNESL